MRDSGLGSERPSRSVTQRRIALGLSVALMLGVATVTGYAEEGGPTDNVSGTVTASDGSPVSGGYVDVYDPSDDTYVDGANGAIGSDGHYSLTAPAGHWELLAHPSTTNPLLDDMGSTLIDVAATPITADIQLVPSGVTGRILAPTGSTGIEGAQVGVFSETVPTGPADVATSTTTGGFGLALAPGDYTLFVHPPADNPNHYAGTTTPITVPASGELHVPDLRLKPSNVFGVVQLPDGTPVADSQIDIYDAANHQVVSGADFTDADGSFGVRVEPVSGGPTSYVVEARKPAGLSSMYTTGRLPVSISDGQTLTGQTITLATVNVTGTVFEPDGTTPAAGVLVDLTTVPAGAYDNPTQLDVTIADDSGNYGFHVDPGTYRIYGHPSPDDPTHAVATYRTITIDDTNTGLAAQDITLLGPDVVGTVRTPDGDPVPGSRVVIADTADSLAPAVTAQTGSDGTYSAALPVGDYDITADPPADNPDVLSSGTAHAQVTDTTQTVTADVSLVAPTIRGRVLSPDGLVAQPDARISVYDVTNQRSVTLGSSSFTDRAGRYGMVLDPGTYRISAAPPFEATGELPAAITVTREAGSSLTGQDIVLASSATAPYSLSAVSVTPDGVTGDSGGDSGVVSADGTHVVFASTSTNLLDTPAASTQSGVYLRDLTADTTALVSATSDGDPADGASDQPAVNADGSTIAYRSTATNLVLDDPSDRADIYVSDFSGGNGAAITRISAGLTDGDTPVEAHSPTISGDGSLVAFVLQEPGSTLGQIELCDRTGATPTCQRVDGTTDQVVDAPALSRDGSTLAFYLYDASAGERHLEVYDVSSGQTTDGGVIALTSALFEPAPSLTADGSLVAFTSYDEGGRGTPSIYHNDATPTITTPTLFDYGPPAGGTADHTLISDDGAFLAFAAAAPDAFAAQQAWVLERASGTTRQVVLGPQGTGSSMPTTPTSISADGSELAFTGSGGLDDVIAYTIDSNGVQDVFLARRHLDQTPPTWPAGAALRTTHVGTTVAALEWDAATDTSGILNYRILQDGHRVGTAGADDRSFLATGLIPDTDYTFAVEAVDAFGNVTTDGPALPVHTSSSTTAGTALLSATPGNDASIDLTWEAAGGTISGYRIYRSAGAGAGTAVGDVSAATTSFHDAGLAAETSYTYHVVTLDSDGAEQPHTIAATATTGDLLPAAITINVPTLSNGLARLGDDVRITVRGSHGRTGSADVDVLSWYDDTHTKLPATVAKTVTVPLAEDSATPGTYRGTFHIADGTARIVGITGHVLDGATHPSTAAATGLPVDVSGGLHVSIDDPDGLFSTGRLTAFDYAGGAGFDRTLTSDAPATTVAVVPGSYDVRLLLDHDRFESAHADHVVVEGGLITDQALRATYPATLTVDLGDEDPTLAGTGVMAEDTAGSSHNGYGTLPSGSHTVTVGNLVSGETVDVSAMVPRTARYLAPVAKSVTLHPGENSTTLAPTPMPTGHVTGMVLKPDGTGAAEASITVAETVDGRQFSTSGETGRDGTFDLTALAASDATVSAAFRDQTLSVDGVDVPTTGVTVPEFQMTDPVPYIVGVDLQTRVAGSSDYAQLSVDWRTAFHYDLLASTRSDRQNYRAFGADGGNDVVVLGRPGDRVTICGDGYYANGVIPYDQVCASAPLGDPNDPPTVQLKFSANGAMTGSLVDGDGTAFTGSWIATFARETATGAQSAGSRSGSGSRFQLPVLEDGTYAVTFSDAADSSKVATASAEVAGSAVADLGELRLTGGKWFGGGSSITPAAADVAPGGHDDVRVVLNNGATDVTDASLRLAIPAPGSIPAGSVTVDGRPATGVSTADGVLVVPMGDIAAGTTSTVHYVLDAASAAPGSTMLAAASMQFTSGGTDHVEWLAPQPVLVDGVTVDAPQSVTTPDVILTGRAPAGDVVTVSDGGAQIGTATAGPGGYWKLSTSLADRGVPSLHFVHATVDHQGETLTSKVALVTYDPDAPELTKVTVYQLDDARPDGRKFSYDPRQGLTRFSFLFVPGQPLVVEATFTHPERVSDVVAHVDGMEGTASAEPNGVFKTQFDHPTGVGDISFDYDVAPTPVDLSLQPPEDEVRASLPSGIAGFTLLSPPTDVGGGFGTDGGGQTMTVGLPGLGKDSDGNPLPLDITITRSAIEYTPTDEDLQREADTGAAIWGVETTSDDDTLTGTLIIPRDTADAPANAPSALTAAHPLRGYARLAPMGAGGGAVAAEEILVKIAKQATEDYGKWGERATVAQMFNHISTGYSLDQAVLGTNYGEIDSLYADLNGGPESCLTPEHTKMLTDEIDALRDQNSKLDRIGVVIDLASPFVAPATFGIGTIALWGVGYGVGKVSNAIMSQRINQVRDNIKFWVKFDNCADQAILKRLEKYIRLHRHRTGTTGASDDLIDPSGYVYSGVASNRIPDVQATVLRSESATGPWTPWNADDYGMVNPEYTNNEGHYGWFVPTGFYQVAFSADGYQPGMSDVVEVLPPHYDVNVDLVPTAAPTVQEVTADANSVLVTFDQYMDVRTVGAAQLSVADAAGPVTGTVAAVDPGTSPDGLTLARSFRFTPQTPFTSGEDLDVSVDSVAQNYAGRLLEAAVHRTVTVPVVGGGGGGGTGAGGDNGGGDSGGDDGTGGDNEGGDNTGGGTSYGSSGGIVVAVTLPNGGTTDITSAGAGQVPAGFRALPGSFVISAPAGTTDQPLTLTFRVARDLIQPGMPVSVFRDGVLASDCVDGTHATPDPCVSSIGHASNGDVLVTVLSTHASTWTLGMVHRGSIAAACRGTLRHPFVDDSSRAAACVSAYGVMPGVSAHRFAPHQKMTRGAARAAFRRLLRLAKVVPPAQFLGAGRHPSHARKAMTRGLLASYLRRSVELAQHQRLPAGSARFVDVGHHHRSAIDAVVTVGLMHNKGVHLFRPRLDVRRRAGSRVLARAIALLVAGGHVLHLN